MIADLDLLSTRAVSALGNGLYQGLILSALTWTALRLMRRANAATRHALELITLVLVAAMPALHFLLARPGPADGASSRGSNAGSDAVPGGANSPTERRRPSAPITFFDETLARELAAQMGSRTETARERRMGNAPRTDWFDGWLSFFVTPEASAPQEMPPDPASSVIFVSRRVAAAEDSERPQFEPAESDDPLEPVAIAETETAGETSIAAVSRFVRAMRGGSMAPRHWRPVFPAGTSLVVLGIWMLIAGFRVAQLAWQCVALQGIRRRSQPAPAAMALLFQKERVEMGIRRSVGLGVSFEVNSPMVTGLGRPLVLLPAGLAAKADPDGERILRHELAHVRRGDDWTNLLQQGIKAILFFHPSVWWLSRRLAIDREIACDDHVLSSKTSRRAYALFLADFAGRTQGRHWAAAPAAWSNQSQLKERISMILDLKRNASPRLARIKAGTLGTTALIVAALGLYCAPRMAIGETPSADDPPQAGRAENVASADATVTIAVTDDVQSSDDGAITVTSVTAGPSGASAASNGGDLSTDSIKAKPRARASAGTPRAVTRSAPMPAHSPHPAALAAVTVAPAPAAHPHPALAAPEPPEAPQFAPMAVEKPPRPGRGDDIERRLERLERLVESLVEKRGKGGGAQVHIDFSSDDAKEKSKDQAKEKAKDLEKQARSAAAAGADPNWQNEFRLQQKAMAGLAAEAKHRALAEHLEKMGAEVERAAKEVERAARDAEIEAKGELAHQADVGPMKGLEIQRRALDKQRQALRRQIAQVEAQLDRLDERLDQIDEQVDRLHDERDRAKEEKEKEKEKGKDKVKEKE